MANRPSNEWLDRVIAEAAIEQPITKRRRTSTKSCPPRLKSYSGLKSVKLPVLEVYTAVRALQSHGGSDILSSLATLSTTNVSTAPDIPTPNTMQSTPAQQQEHSRHAAYAARTRDAPLTVEHSKVAQLLVPHLKRLARHLNVPQKVDGSNKDKPKLIADIVAPEVLVHARTCTVR
jgi:hypothetical protein